MQVRYDNLLIGALDKGLNVQLNIVVAQALGEGLCQYVCAVQCSLAGSGNVEVNAYWEGYALCGQFFHSLFFVLSCFVCVQSYHGLAVEFRQSHFLSYQFGIFGTVRGINKTFHGEEVVFAGHWVNCVGSLVVIREIQSVPPGQSECFVSDCSVPVGIRCAIFVLLVVVQLHLVGVLGWNVWNQVIVQSVVRIFCDGVDSGFAQLNVIDLAGLIQLVCYVVGLYHLGGNGVKAFALGIPVHWVLGEHFFVALDVRGHGVASVVPHVLVVHCFYCICATQLINHALGQWVQSYISSQRVKVWFLSYTVVNNSVVVWGFETYHFAELGAFSSGQRFSLILRQGLGVLIVLFSAFDHLNRHCGVVGVVLVEVENPLQTGSKVLCITVCFFIAVDIDPFYAFAYFECPGQTAIFAAPLFCDTWNQLTLWIGLQQAVYQAGQVFAIF